jgi:hypothetical protein
MTGGTKKHSFLKKLSPAFCNSSTFLVTAGEVKSLPHDKSSLGLPAKITSQCELNSHRYLEACSEA